MPVALFKDIFIDVCIFERQSYYSNALQIDSYNSLRKGSAMSCQDLWHLWQIFFLFFLV